MEEGSFNVKAPDFVVISVCECQYDMYGCEFDNRSISFAVVLWSLTKSLSNQAGLLFSDNDRAIRIVFIVAGPANTDGFPTV
jgi:hypothetical protein